MKWILSLLLITGVSLFAEDDDDENKKEPRKSLIIGKKVTKSRTAPKKKIDNTNRELGSSSKTRATRTGISATSRPDKAFREEFLEIMHEVTGSEDSYKVSYKKDPNIIKSRFDLTWDLLVAEVTQKSTKERFKKEVAKAAAKRARKKTKKPLAKGSNGLSPYRNKYYTKKFAVQEKDIASKNKAIDKIDLKILENSKGKSK